MEYQVADDNDNEMTKTRVAINQLEKSQKLLFILDNKPLYCISSENFTLLRNILATLT